MLTSWERSLTASEKWILRADRGRPEPPPRTVSGIERGRRTAASPSRSTAARSGASSGSRTSSCAPSRGARRPAREGNQGEGKGGSSTPGEDIAPPADEPIVADGPPSESQVHRSAADSAVVAAQSSVARTSDQEEGRSEPAELETSRLRAPGSILEQLAAERSLLDRFRLVRGRLAELSTSSDLAQVVEEFPPGWARRRFVTPVDPRRGGGF